MQAATPTRYRATNFLLSVNQLNQLPPDQGREVALAGRSNAGKSSALNLLTGQKKLARISKTPGRTQLINYFEVEPKRYLVDLPGYGYAKAPVAMRQHWGQILQAYFARRKSLCGLLLIMDIRHPLTPLDQQMLDWCKARQLNLGILLSKADKLKRGPALNTLQQVRKQLQLPAEVILFSAVDGRGTAEALALLERWLFAQDAVESIA
jgi:GTP-binding protein